MAYYFETYYAKSKLDINAKQKFDIDLNKFLDRNRNHVISIDDEFSEIKNFLVYQGSDFFEETFLTTSAKIINNLSSYSYSEQQIAMAQTFVNMLKDDAFKKVLPKLNNYATSGTFNFVYYLLSNNNIILAENITNIFVHPEKRTLKSFKENIVEWALKNTKIAALKFLVNHYDGFNEENIQSLFLNYAELSEDYISKVFPNNIYPNALYISKVFPNNIYPNALEGSFQSFFNNTSIVISKKLELISYFSKKTDVIPKELMGFLYKGLKENTISLDSLKNYDFYEKIFTEENTINFIPANTNSYLSTLKDYLIVLKQDNAMDEKIFKIILKLKDKSDALVTFVNDYPEKTKEKTKEIKEIVNKDEFIIKDNLVHALSKLSVMDDELKEIVQSKNKYAYFILNSPDTDKKYIEKFAMVILETGYIPNVTNRVNINKHSNEIINYMIKKQGVEETFKTLFINNGMSRFSDLYENFKGTLVLDIESYSEQNLQHLKNNFEYKKDVVNSLDSPKWYKFNYEKPLQIVFKNNSFSVIKDPTKKVIIEPIESEETFEVGTLSNIIQQAKKDLNKFNQITDQPLDFNLEFKIKATSIFMQQMSFLTQIQKIENEVNVDDLYFLKSNLGKYLMQCTETYSRALTRYQTLLENPSLLKKQDVSLESQKEKIDSEALKQIALLEKELDFVKENVINTINSDSIKDMRINTRFLESKVEHPSSEDNIVKIVNKPR